MRNPDGTETLLMLAFPLPLALMAELCKGIGKAAERAGFTDAALITDGSGRIVARRAETGGDRG